MMYVLLNDWDYPTALLNAASVQFGCMYGVPSDIKSHWSKYFTLFFYIWGLIVMAYSIGYFTNKLFIKVRNIARKERRKLQMNINDALANEISEKELGINQLVHISSSIQHNVRIFLPFMFLLIWIIIGVIYAYRYENWNINEAIYFSLAAVSASGLKPPLCIGEDSITCSIGTFRALFYSFYIIIGVPLFTYCFGAMFEIIFGEITKKQEIDTLLSPLTKEDYYYALSLRSFKFKTDNNNNNNNNEFYNVNDYYNNNVTISISNELINNDIKDEHDNSYSFRSESSVSADTTTSVDLCSFIVMELLRMKRVEESDINHIKVLFNAIDENGSGVVNLANLKSHNLFCDSLRSDSIEALSPTALSNKNSTRGEDMEEFQPLFNSTGTPLANDSKVEPMVHVYNNHNEIESNFGNINYNQFVIPLMRQISNNPSRKRTVTLATPINRKQLFPPSTISRRHTVSSNEPISNVKYGAI
eukprot:gene14091-18910_t